MILHPAVSIEHVREDDALENRNFVPLQSLQVLSAGLTSALKIKFRGEKTRTEIKAELIEMLGKIMHETVVAGRGRGVNIDPTAVQLYLQVQYAEAFDASA